MLTVLDACAAALSSGSAPDPRAVQPERPSVATHAGTVAPGYVEIETGVETDRNADGTHALQVPTLVKVGIAPQVQLSVLAPVLRTTDLPLGIGDVGVGVKWRLAGGGGALARGGDRRKVAAAGGGGAARGGGDSPDDDVGQGRRPRHGPHRRWAAPHRQPHHWPGEH